MDILKDISSVVDVDEFKTGKTSGDDGDKKRARARLYQIDLEMNQLGNKIAHIESELVRLNKKMAGKEEKYTPEVQTLIKLLEDSPANE